MRHKHDPPDLYLAAVNGKLTYHGRVMWALHHQIIPLNERKTQKSPKKKPDVNGYLHGESWSMKFLRERFGSNEPIPV